ncbi:hypothetical protein [Brucella thiophenivorans]|uniref:Uncharacterized protein n=1 Tax=Brucella thiophenivorans TaxID=571255 RepID=A0A256FUW9_9HYPH|nr:hypothetical protein [Brucella thiophenivorans]OYR18221.1 hypothetical protein CEV31_4233 [Brucella thiophenivorans]
MDEQCEIIAKLRKICTASGVCKEEQDEMIAITTRKAQAGIHFDESSLSKHPE